MNRKQSRVEGFDGHWKYLDMLPSHSEGHRIHEEVSAINAVAIAERWANLHPPQFATSDEKQPYLMVTSWQGDRIAVWRAKDGAWVRER